MLTLAEAQAAIAERIVAAGKTETVPLRAAAGRYTAAELRAAVDNPAFDNSAMDGYALCTPDLVTNSFVLPQAGEARCGDAPGRLASNTCQRIFTGAPLPAGADTVEIQENVRLEPGCVVFPRTVQPGQNIRRQGEDFKRDDALYGPGRRLTVYDLALLSAAGVAAIPVYARPRALVVATGDELVAPGTPLQPGQIYESNRLVTLLQLEALGVETVDGGVVRDDAGALRDMLKSAADYDFVITSGGASVGDHDLVKQVFARIGEINFWKVKIKPGKPVAFGRVGERGHFFALPGNPVSSLVTFKLFVEPALAAWHHARYRLVELPALADNDFRRHAGRMEFLRARLGLRDGRLHATALHGQGSHMLGPLRQTNGFIRLAEDSTGFTAGDTVAAIPLGLGGEGWD
ncbi:MAG TPA: gephyrin-like molybdotransferase Glp [Acidiferrobacterales bacterium]